MATALQKQLATIAASSTYQLDLRAQKSAHGKSLLFDYRTAASQSFESVYLICYEGYKDLCALDPRFLAFAKNLFSEQSKAEDRTQMTKEENRQLNKALEAFITLVGPRILLKPAEKALEWLVRRFRYVGALEVGAPRWLTAAQDPRVQHGMPRLHIPTLPQHPPVPCASLDTAREPVACHSIPLPIHPVADERAPAHDRVHRHKHTRLLQGLPIICG
jgi:hypothetical protein